MVHTILLLPLSSLIKRGLSWEPAKARLLVIRKHVKTKRFISFNGLSTGGRLSNFDAKWLRLRWIIRLSGSSDVIYNSSGFCSMERSEYCQCTSQRRSSKLFDSIQFFSIANFHIFSIFLRHFSICFLFNFSQIYNISRWSYSTMFVLSIRIRRRNAIKGSMFVSDENVTNSSPLNDKKIKCP